MVEIPTGSQADVPDRLRRVTAALLLVVLVSAFVARLIPSPRTIDDAFITFRYSRNLVEGAGFVYNPGSRTLGTTTPLYTLWMAACGALSGSEHYPWFALLTNAAADAITAALLAWLALRLTRHWLPALVLGLAWACNPLSVTFAVGGMETSVSVLWAVAAATFYAAGHNRTMAVFAALGVLTRVDALIWVGLLFGHQFLTGWWAQRGRSATDGGRARWRWLPWRSWMIFAGMLLPWAVFSVAYFGVLLPNSLRAKQLAYTLEPLQAVIRLLQVIATPFAEHLTLGVPGVMIGIVLYPALAAVGISFALRRIPRLLPFLVYPWVYVAVFSVMNPLMFRWYVVPLLPAYLLAIVVGIWALLQALADRAGVPRAQAAAMLVVGACALLLTLNAWRLHPDHGPDRPAPRMAWHAIELNYQRMGERLRSVYGVTPETLVAAGDIGAVGYFSRARILDTVGLVTPELSRYYPIDRALLIEGANYAVPPAIVFDYRPDYLVLMEGFVRNGLARMPEFDALYALVEEIPTDYYGTGMLLYQRRDLSVGDGAGEPQVTPGN